MSKFEDGSYGSLTGIALIGKVLAGRCQMHYTKAAVGNGTIPEGLTPKTMTGPAGYVMDAQIAAVSNPVDGECQVTVRIKSESVESGFYLTNIVLFAEDPDDGEVPYTYLCLENEPEWIRPASSVVGKLATFDLIAAVGDVDTVITGSMCFVRKLPLMCPFYKHSAVRVGFGHRFLNRSSSGTSFIFVIIVIVDFLTQFFSFLGYLFAKLFLVHLRGLGDLFLLELLFIRGCFNMCSVDKNHAWVYHPVVQCFVQNMCKNFFTQLRGKAFAKGITYRCKVRNLVQ